MTLNGRAVAQVTGPDGSIRPSEFWRHFLKDAAENVKNPKVDHTQRVRLDDASIVASVKDWSQQDLHQQFERANIRSIVIEKQLLVRNNIFRLGKQVKLQIPIKYRGQLRNSIKERR